MSRDITNLMVKDIKTIKVNKKEVSCKGEANSTEHPLVYLRLTEKEGIVSVECPYCSTVYVYEK